MRRSAIFIWGFAGEPGKDAVEVEAAAEAGVGGDRVDIVVSCVQTACGIPHALFHDVFHGSVADAGAEKPGEMTLAHKAKVRERLDGQRL